MNFFSVKVLGEAAYILSPLSYNKVNFFSMKVLGEAAYIIPPLLFYNK